MKTCTNVGCAGFDPALRMWMPLNLATVFENIEKRQIDQKSRERIIKI
jgi:hypothetical protein